MKKYKIGGQFSGVGAFDFALNRLGIDYENVYQAEWDKYARQTYLENHAEPNWYVKDVNDTPIDEIPSLDIAMFSPPCQAFSLAGKRKGEDDKRGILFYNSHEFITKNKPRYFIFENVKGLLSDNGGKTFQRWIDMLGGKSVNGNPVIFPLDEATPYHVYHRVLNAKDYGVPQNRERVFIIGIRDDSDNVFSWPKKQHLTKRLKDVLESDVDEKYYLSEKMLSYLNTRSANFNGGKINYKGENDTASCITKSSHSLDISDNIIKEGFIKQDTQGSQVYSEKGVSPTLSAGTHGYAQGYVKVKSATKDGFEIAKEGDSINFSQMSSKTRRGRVGKEVAQTLDTACNQAVMVSKEVRTQEAKNQRKKTGSNDFRGKEIEFRESETMNCITSGLTNDHFIKIGAIRGRGEENNQQLEINQNGTSNSLTTVQKDNVVCELRKDEGIRYFKDNICGTIRTIDAGGDKHIIERNNLFNTDKNSIFNGNKTIEDEQRNTIKVLSALQQEVGSQEIETWGLRILEVIREKEVLQQRLYEESFQGKTKKTSNRIIDKIQSSKGTTVIATIIMRSLPKEKWERCTPQRRKSIKQLIRQLNKGVQKLSFENSQTEINMQSRKLQYKNERLRLLREALSKIQKIWQSINGETQPIQQDYRIRRLTPREAFRLMDFPDTFDFSVVSNSQAYRQAGNSIVVNVLAEIIKKLKL